MSTPSFDPPPRRALPPAARARLRQEVDAVGDRAPAPHGPARWVLPWLGAAAVAAVVVGAVWWTAPGRELSVVPGSPTVSTTPATVPDPSTSAAAQTSAPDLRARWSSDGRPVTAAELERAHQPARLMDDPAAAYAECVGVVRDRASINQETVPAPTGRLAATNGVVTTVVVADSTHAWTCNTSPDQAVSPRLSATSPGAVADPTTWAVAAGSGANYWSPASPYCVTPSRPQGWPTDLPMQCAPVPSAPPGIYSGDLLWAGGRLPAGVTGLTYVLPDGRSVPAVVKDGWWVVQDLSTSDWMPSWTTGLHFTVELSDGRTTVVPIGQDTVCHQVSHGC